MEHEDPGEAVTELRERRPGALELLQGAAGSGLAAYAVWALLLQPGFRRVPLRLQVRSGPGAGRAEGATNNSARAWAGPKVRGWTRGAEAVPAQARAGSRRGGGLTAARALCGL
jgi:hypothetical protein